MFQGCSELQSIFNFTLIMVFINLFMLFLLINIVIYFKRLNIITLGNDFTQHNENILSSILMRY